MTVVGDVREHNLGLDAQVGDVIRKEANIIVNSAATTDFRERLYESSCIGTYYNCIFKYKDLLIIMHFF